MDKQYFIALYDYNFWAHRRVWNCVMQLSEEQYNYPLDYSIGSIYIQTLHTMAVEHWWFHFLCEGTLNFLEEADFPSRPTIRTQWDQTEAYIRAYLDTLTTKEMNREVMPPFWENKPAIKVWEAITQVANHSTDHRAQTLAGLHRLGAPTLGQDYLDYIFDKQKTLDQ
jgi:uncharacterized damage-inducible protein DinB